MCLMRSVLRGAKRVQTSVLIRNHGLSLANYPPRNGTLFYQGNGYMKYFSSSDKRSDTLNVNKESDVSTANLTQAQKLKKAVAEYGGTVIVFHVCISLISLGTCYLIVSSGLDVQQLLINLKLENWLKGNTMLVSNAGTFAVAYAIHKIFAPVRITVTLGSVPFIVRYLRLKGILKK